MRESENFITKREFELALARIHKRLLALRPTAAYEKAFYTKPEVDELLALQDELSELGDIDFTNPIADNILAYNGTKWFNFAASLSSLNFSFDEGVLEEVVTDIIHALKKLMKIYDEFDGVINIDEGVMA